MPMKVIFYLLIALTAFVLGDVAAFAQTAPGGSGTASSRSSPYVQPNTSFSNPFAPGGLYDPYHGPLYEPHHAHPNSSGRTQGNPGSQTPAASNPSGASPSRRAKKRDSGSGTTHFPNQNNINSRDQTTCLNNPQTSTGGQIIGNGAISASSTRSVRAFTGSGSCANQQGTSSTARGGQDTGNSSNSDGHSQMGASKAMGQYGSAAQLQKMPINQAPQPP